MPTSTAQRNVLPYVPWCTDINRVNSGRQLSLGERRHAFRRHPHSNSFVLLVDHGPQPWDLLPRAHLRRLVGVSWRQHDVEDEGSVGVGRVGGGQQQRPGHARSICKEQ